MIGLSFVAFVDILGFGEMVVADCESATPGELYLPKLKSAIHEALAHAQSVDAKISQFSDSIVVSSPFKADPEAFSEFLSLVRGFQSLLYKNGMLCRGGVSHGRHFHDETLLFSQALIEAYKLESQIARDPRIIISPETISLLFPSDIDLEGVLRYSDGQFFIDYLQNLDLETIQSIMHTHRPMLNSSNSNVRAKIAWLFKYANFSFPDFPIPDEISIRKCSNKPL